MERNVKISLEKAREWYNSGNESLKEVALQAFKESELIINHWETIKTFEDACKVLSINPTILDLIYDSHLKKMYKLQIVRKALNGIDWKPKLNTGTIYYPWMRYYPKGSSGYKGWEPIANFKNLEDNEVYILAGGGCYNYSDGLGHYGCGYGDCCSHLGLFSCKSREIAKHFSITFGKLIFDVIYGQYNNYIWVKTE